MRQQEYALSLVADLLDSAETHKHGPFTVERLEHTIISGPNVNGVKHRYRYRVQCVSCGMSADATAYPRPNQVDIGGELVALDCGSEW